ncbi:DUF6541 family protein [Naasia sp. SYSU D00948]|uniref:DUF6541 family protein n=1 Tax=Naasia sp. SYSU D00948 TaxID=2817379 RepID=UPI001B303CF8|nr:DUF6541 family protein [Naasia sp. SYSU D00948]
MPDWLGAAPAVLAAALWILVPGGLLAWALGLRGLRLLALSGALSVALIGTSAVLASLLSVPFGWCAPAALTVPAAVLALLVRRRRSRPPQPAAGTTAIVAACVVAATVLTGWIAFQAVPSPGLVSQSYDGVFHLNAVAWIQATGDASSFTLYRMTHPGTGLEFYPAAWHAAVSLVADLPGVSIPVATNAVWIVTAGAVFAAGSAFLAAVLAPASADRRIVAAVAALAASASAGFPYLLLEWGVLYPTGLAMALMPAGLALLVETMRGDLGRRAGALLVGLWLVAEAFAHPRALFSFAVFAVPAVAAFGLARLRPRLRDPGTRRRTLLWLAAGVLAVLLAGAAAAYLVLEHYAVSDRPISDRLNGGPAIARQSLGESFLQVLLLTPPAGPGESALPVPWALVVATIAGLIACLLHPGTRWVPVAFLLAGILYTLSAGSNSDLAKLATGVWYKDKFRLYATLAMVVPALAALGVHALARAVAERLRPRLRPLLAAALAAVVLLTSWPGASLRTIAGEIGDQFRIAEDKDGRLLDTGTAALLEQLPELTPADAVIVGNPWNGSALTWAIGDREPLFPHLTGDWDPDRLLVASGLDLVSADARVCEALDRLGATHVLVSPGLLWNGDPQAELFAGIDRTDPAALGPEVARSGDATLHRITACG